MPPFTVARDEYRFLISDVLAIERHAALPGFDQVTPDMLGPFLDGAARLCEQVAHPLNQPGDVAGCRFENGAVTTPAGVPAAYRRFADDGWIGLALDPAYGGQGLPAVLSEAVYDMLCGANVAFSGFIELTEAAFAALHAHGTDAQKALYLPKLARGEWTGAMHLTEAQAGSDLGLMATRAEPAGGGSFRLHGTKIFITNAEHDLAANIVNLVLARLPDAPVGTRGISLFVVPKHLPDRDGNPGVRNAIRCGGLEHKMGMRVQPTGTYHLDGATGWLVGAPHRGLPAMFTMVNDARLGVALQGLGIAEAARQAAAAWARERRQGRSLDPALRGNDAADPILVHPDVRRMLMTMRACTEGARALGLFVALQIDLSRRHPDGAERARAERLVSLLTPVIKALFTDWGSEVADLAIQVHGGYGYVCDIGVDQFLRDARVTRIYEGTNGIQALDLVRRKLPMEDGAALADLLARVETAIAAGGDLPIAAALTRAMGDLRAATAWIDARRGPAPLDAIGGATDYLRLLGLVAVGWAWLRMATLSRRALAEGRGDPGFHRAKLVTADFFARRQLAETPLLRQRACLGSGDLMALDADRF